MKNFYTTSILIVMTVIVLSCCSGCSSTRTYSEEEKNAIAAKKYSLDQLQHDFKQLRHVIETENPLVFADKQELSDTFDRQYALLRDNMSILDFYRVISPAVAKVRCGHTNLSISAVYEQYMRENAKYLPFTFFVTGNKLFVIESLTDAHIPPGSEILRINGRSAGDIITQLLRNLTADGENVTKKYVILNNWFNSFYYFYIEAPQSFEIRYADPAASQEHTITVNGLRDDSMDQTALGVYFPTKEEHELYHAKIEEEYAVLTIETFILREKDAYREFLRRFFKELHEQEIEHLILDLRGNWGGSAPYAATLLSYLIKKPVQYFNEDLPFFFSLVYSYLKSPMDPAEDNFTGNLYVLVNGGVFSTTAHLCSLIKYHDIGVLIGTETGGNYICTDGAHNMTLKNTKLRLHYSTTPYKTEVKGFEKGRGLMPDYPVEKTLEDVLLQQDPFMEKALELISEYEYL